MFSEAEEVRENSVLPDVRFTPEQNACLSYDPDDVEGLEVDVDGVGSILIKIT